jgi:sugar lactone lactonase YvrE
MSKAGAFEAVLLMILVLLSTVMILVVLDGPDRVSVHSDWNITGDGPVSKIFMAEDGTVYLFGGENGNTVSAFGPVGDKKWTYEVPGRWLVSKQAFAVDDSTVYLYLYENDLNMTMRYGSLVNFRNIVDRGYWTGGNRSIMAISRHGKMLWHADVPNGISYYGTSLYASGGRVYYYNNDRVMVIDGKGRILFNVSDIYGPPTVDEHGNVYVAKMFYDNGEFGPGKTIEAYHPDGTLYWRKDMGRTIYGMSNL